MPQLVSDPQALCRAVEGITAGGSTALHAGWLEGAMLSAQFHDPRALNRVLLLSDGQANAGETRPEVIAQHVRGLTARGVGTSTVGLGRSYDEALLQAMADAGDGNYEHIEDAGDLPGFFQAELQGLTRTTGHTVSLGVEPNPAVGSLRQEVLNDLPRNDLGRWQLPNLIAGQPVEVVFTVQVPAQPRAGELGVTRVRVAWTDREGRRHRVRAQLDLPVLEAAAYDRLAEDERVRVAAERLRAARVREQAVAYAVAGQVQLSREALSRERRRLAAFQSAGLLQEVAALGALDADFGRDEQLARKRATSQSYNARRSKDPQSR
jgi:Ca-activated chloride channel family protein